MDHNSTMEYRIGLEKQNKRNDQVTELILDNCRASQISGLTEEFVNLETLSLINVGLTTLKGFPKLPKLKKLELSDNRLTGGLNLLHGSPNLQHLNISGNRIKDFDALEPLKEFHDLASLDLYNCEVTKADEYRKKVFDLLPNLKALDGYDREEREVADSDEDDDEGSDVENHITREDNESDEDDEEAVDDDDDDNDDDDGEVDDDDDDDGSYDESFDEMEGDYLPKGPIDPCPEVSDEEDDDYDDDDDDDDDMGDEEEEQNSNGDLAATSREQNPVHHNNNNSAAEHNDLDGGDDEVQEIVDESRDVDDDEGENDGEDAGDEEEEEDDDGEDDADLKLLEKDNIVEDEDDADFEPTHEPDERDHEIDPEDDADDDNAEGDTTGQLSSSKLDTTTASEVDDTGDKRGQKRKLEDEGGDEIEGETAPAGQE